MKMSHSDESIEGYGSVPRVHTERTMGIITKVERLPTIHDAVLAVNSRNYINNLLKSSEEIDETNVIKND